eukprot:m.436854 g.436854  ORF g.436854 m.436854 type:complete len:94 (-) comp21426_c0_seq42:182-463(-)
MTTLRTTSHSHVPGDLQIAWTQMFYKDKTSYGQCLYIEPRFARAVPERSCAGACDTSGFPQCTHPCETGILACVDVLASTPSLEFNKIVVTER